MGDERLQRCNLLMELFLLLCGFGETLVKLSLKIFYVDILFVEVFVIYWLTEEDSESAAKGGDDGIVENLRQSCLRMAYVASLHRSYLHIVFFCGHILSDTVK